MSASLIQSLKMSEVSQKIKDLSEQDAALRSTIRTAGNCKFVIDAVKSHFVCLPNPEIQFENDEITNAHPHYLMEKALKNFETVKHLVVFSILARKFGYHVSIYKLPDYIERGLAKPSLYLHDNAFHYLKDIRINERDNALCIKTKAVNRDFINTPGISLSTYYRIYNTGPTEHEFIKVSLQEENDLSCLCLPDFLEKHLYELDCKDFLKYDRFPHWTFMQDKPEKPEGSDKMVYLFLTEHTYPPIYANNSYVDIRIGDLCETPEEAVSTSVDHLHFYYESTFNSICLKLTEQHALELLEELKKFTDITDGKHYYHEVELRTALQAVSGCPELERTEKTLELPLPECSDNPDDPYPNYSLDYIRWNIEGYARDYVSKPENWITKNTLIQKNAEQFGIACTASF